MKQYDVAVVGEIYIDHILTGFAKWPQPGEEVFTNEYMQEVGGGAAITACALARLGRSVSLIGAVGVKEMSWLECRLSSFGVSSAELSSSEGRTGVTISVSNDTDRSFFTYVGENARLEEATDRRGRPAAFDRGPACPFCHAANGAACRQPAPDATCGRLHHVSRCRPSSGMVA